MRIFLAGASGVIGVRLLPLLAAAGHEVTAMTRSPDKLAALRELGAHPVLCDVFDRPALLEAVQAAKPHMVMHQLTDLPEDVKRIALYMRRNNRIRTEGTRNLIAAAQAAGVERLMAQSIAWRPPFVGRAVAEHERLVLEAGGVVLRYGQFFGPGTFYPNRMPSTPRIGVDAAAKRTVELLDVPAGVVTVTDSPGG